MVRTVRRWSILAALMMMVGLLAVPTGASAGNGNGDKVYVCHTTHAEKNPWVVVWIDRSGWENGHEGQHVSEWGTDKMFEPAAVADKSRKQILELCAVPVPPTGVPTSEGDTIPACPDPLAPVWYDNLGMCGPIPVG